MMDVSHTAIPLFGQLSLEDKSLTLHPSLPPQHYKSVRQLIKYAEKSNIPLDASLKGFVAHKDGCHIHGKVTANKVQGLIQITGREVHGHTNFTHQIDRLSFGNDFPGISNPLDTSYDVAEKEHMMFQYYLSLVPTAYFDSSMNYVLTNQYAVTEHRREINHDAGSHGVPGIMFHYSLEPISVKIKEFQQSYLHTLTRVCGLIGGVFVTAGLAHRILRTAVGTVLPKKKE